MEITIGFNTFERFQIQPEKVSYCAVNNFEYFSLKLDQRVFQAPDLTNSALSIHPPQIACFPSLFGPEIVQYAKAFN